MSVALEKTVVGRVIANNSFSFCRPILLSLIVQLDAIITQNRRLVNGRFAVTAGSPPK